VKGFENGRHLLAYRFIFPLKYEGAHIGSVELSVGVKELIDIMNRVYGDGYSYLLEKDKIFRNYTGTTAEELKNFTISEDFVMESCEACDFHSRPLITAQEVKAELQQSVKSLNYTKIKGYKAFAEESQKFQNVSFAYLPIYDVNDIGMGYIISHSDVTGYTDIRKEYRTLFIFVSIGAASLVLIVFALNDSRRKAADMNYILEKRVT